VESDLVKKIMSSGPAAMSPLELLAIGIVSDEGDVDGALPFAKELLTRAGGIRNLPSAPPTMFEECAGVNGFRLQRLYALLELGRRTAGVGRGERRIISDPQQVYDTFEHLKNERKEHFCALLLDAKHYVIKDQTVHIGTVSASVVGVKEFFKEPIREGCAAVIAVHNHPSGDPTPSAEDFEVTRVLAEAGKLLEIPLLDHVIIGENSFTSMQRLGAIR
jgi:DNA repair protein RadC